MQNLKEYSTLAYTQHRCRLSLRPKFRPLAPLDMSSRAFKRDLVPLACEDALAVKMAVFTWRLSIIDMVDDNVLGLNIVIFLNKPQGVY